MQNRFVVITGLPGSGKSTLARQLAAALALPMFDKDEILERLFDTAGTGDTAHRRALSRQSDSIFQTQALALSGAVLVSFWHQPGMPDDSGTPTGWLSRLPAPVVNVHCICPPEIAAERFARRTRHAGHLDFQRPMAALLADLQHLASLPPPALGPRIDVDTTFPIDLKPLLHRITIAN